MDPEHVDDCGDEKLQYHQSGTIAALAEDEIIGEDDECDDSYNDVNVGEGFLQMQQAQMPPSDAGNGGFQSSNANVIVHRAESMVSQGADNARAKGLSWRPTLRSLPNMMMKRKRPSFLISNLPQELLIKILIKLPPKPLIQFRCVSKSWKSLISSPYFISLHTQQAVISRAESIKKRDRMILRILSYCTSQESICSVHIDDGHFTNLEDIEMEDPLQDKVRYYHRIVGACNGVFCLSDDFFGSLRSVMLWNPVIKRKVILPCPRAKSSGNGSSLFVLGFGFDAHNNDYKVVKIDCARKKYVPPEVEVYALSTGNWRKINGNIPRNCIVEHLWPPQVFLNGNVHWTAYRRIGAMHNQFENLIMVFGIANELFDEMPLPGCLKNEAPLRLNITIFEQSIAVGHSSVSGWMQSKSFSIWVMKNYGDEKSWNKLYNFDCYRATMRSEFLANGGALFASRNEHLYSYDSFTGERCDLSMTKFDWFYFFSEPYVESLVLLNEVTEARVMSIESAKESECESFSSYSSYDGGFLAEVRAVRTIEFWKMPIA